MASIIHHTAAANREISVNMELIRRSQLLRKQLQVFSTLALAGANNKSGERHFNVFQQCYQFLISKGTRDKLSKSLWKET